MTGSTKTTPSPSHAGAKPFLASHRALSVCTRELARLSSDVVRRVEALCADGAAEKPIVRQTPGHCIVQLGPVALTIAWLRSTIDSAADGELLVIVWRGMVAPGAAHPPERTAASHNAPTAATAVWEEAYVAVASSEATWTWRRTAADGSSHTSAQLAEQCVERLRRARAGSSRA